MTIYEKLCELQKQQPRLALVTVNCENSPFISYSGNSRNCYLITGSEYDEDCYYGLWLYYSNNCTDCDYCDHCELCYDCTDCLQCYNCMGCQDCNNTRDSYYSYDLLACDNCFGCVGLRRKSYCFFNQQLSKEEYFKKLEEWKKYSKEQIMHYVDQLKLKTPRAFVHQANNEDSSGDYIYNCKGAKHSFDVKDLEDCMYMNNSVEVKDTLDCSNMYFKSELNYQVMSAMNLYNSNFCVTCFDSNDLEYCENVYNSKYCFGSFTVNHGEYLIFNEQYSEEDYFKKLSEIKEQMKKEGDYGRLLPTSYPELFDEKGNPLVHDSKAAVA